MKLKNYYWKVEMSEKQLILKIQVYLLKNKIIMIIIMLIKNYEKYDYDFNIFIFLILKLFYM